MKNINIEQFLSLEGYDTEVRKARRKNAKGTQEFFTPYSIVKKMADKVDEDIWKDKTKTFLEPCFGNGQFIIYIIYKRLMSGVDIYDTLKTLYGTELMADNVKETKERIFKLLDEMEVEYDKRKVTRILNKNIKEADFFKWDYEQWKTI